MPGWSGFHQLTLVCAALFSKVTPLTDLTTAIKASVSDVEFELMLTIALVVMVIFVFCAISMRP